MTGLHGPENPAAMTLVELVVSLAVMVVMIAFIAAIFNQSASVVSMAQANGEINSRIRCASQLIRDDFRAASAGGIAILLSHRVAGFENRSAIILFAQGSFTSVCTKDSAGNYIKANAAMIVYYIARDAQTGEKNVLCRSVFLLSGREDMPNTLEEMLANTPAGTLNPLASCDVLGETLGGIYKRFLCFHVRNSSGYIIKDFLLPVIDSAETAGINLEPLTFDDDVNGGVKQLWPFLASGVEAMELAYSDGYNEDGTVPQPQEKVQWWLYSLSDQRKSHSIHGLKRRSDRFLPPVQYEWVFWKYNEDVHSLKVELTMSAPRNNLQDREFEIICPF